MNERDNAHIQRIKSELRFLAQNLKDIDKDRFLDDELLQHAITMSFIVIGECSNHLSEKFRKNHAEIDWVRIIAVRHVASHGYWQLDMEQIWQATIDDIPKLKTFFDGF